MENVEIIHFTKEDLAEIEILFFLNVPKYFASHEYKDFLFFLEKHHQTYFVAKKNGSVFGCGGYCIIGNNRARLSWDFIHPNFKGLGIGSKIITHCISKIKENKKISSIEVWTSQYAYKFYAKFGFKVIEIMENHWAKGLHLYRMSNS